MRYPVSIPGLEGHRVELVTSQWTGNTRVLVNGNPVQSGRKRGEFLVRCPDGRQAVIQLTPKFAFDGAIRLTVDGVPQVLGTPLTPVEIVLVWMPIALMFAGGMIGGICAGLAISVNLILIRSRQGTWIKYLGAIAMTACALILYITIVSVIYPYLHPAGPSQSEPNQQSVQNSVQNERSVPHTERLEPNDLALGSKGAKATSDSELASEPGCTPNVNDGILATPYDFTNRWHSSITTPHPHWVQVTLPEPESVGKVVINFADPLGYATSFQGVATVEGRTKVLFDVTEYHSGQVYTKIISPIKMKAFRLIIRKSANPAYPHAAQVSEIALYPPADR